MDRSSAFLGYSANERVSFVERGLTAFFFAYLLLLLPLGREINADVRTGFPNLMRYS